MASSRRQCWNGDDFWGLLLPIHETRVNILSKKNFLVEFLRPHRTIPQVPWTAKSRWDLSPLRVTILVIALLFFGLGDALLIQSHTGNAPWSVFAQGLSIHTGLDLGICTFIISGFILLLWWPLGERTS